MELLPAPMLTSNDILDVGNVIFSYNQHGEHVGEDVPLSDRGSRTSLPIMRIVSSKSLLQRRIDMVLEDSSQIDRILFEIVE